MGKSKFSFRFNSVSTLAHICHRYWPNFTFLDDMRGGSRLTKDDGSEFGDQEEPVNPNLPIR